MKLCEMTLENFPICENNLAAYKITEELIKNPNQYTIVLITGPVNDTMHLKQAIKRAFHPDDFVAQSTSDLTDDLIVACRNNTYGSSVQQHISHKMYLLDDIQFLAGKECTQTAAYEIIKARFEKGLLTILFSDCDMRILQDVFERRLVELISLGEIAEIKRL